MPTERRTVCSAVVMTFKPKPPTTGRASHPGNRFGRGRHVEPPTQMPERHVCVVRVRMRPELKFLFRRQLESGYGLLLEISKPLDLHLCGADRCHGSMADDLRRSLEKDRLG